MKTKRNLAVLFLAALCLAILTGVAGAEEQAKGRVKSIDLETNTVVVTTYDGQNVPITISVEDTLTLNKLKERRIKVDDDINAKFINKDGKNVATYFKKTAGC